MSEHAAKVQWKRTSTTFTYETYNRDHSWSFDGGITVRASATPAYMGVADAVDPEEALVAALSSCHMLTFLAIAAKKRLTVESYEDDAVGVLDKNATGQMAITKVTLRPKVMFSGDKLPTEQEIADIHDKAHHNCFIANSVKTEVTVASR